MFILFGFDIFSIIIIFKITFFLNNNCMNECMERILFLFWRFLWKNFIFLELFQGLSSLLELFFIIFFYIFGKKRINRNYKRRYCHGIDACLHRRVLCWPYEDVSLGALLPKVSRATEGLLTSSTSLVYLGFFLCKTVFHNFCYEFLSSAFL